jgi:deoxyribonuclease-4
MMKIGAHVSISGGIDKAIDRALEIGAETIQIFASSPQVWAFKPPNPSTTASFVSKASAAAIDPVFLHAIYLVNLGTQAPDHLNKSIDALTKYMHVAAEIGASGVIFHVGSHKGAGFAAVFDQVVKSIGTIIDQSPDHVWLVIENSAGMGQHICCSFREIGQVINAVGSPRVKVCLDTQHLFAAGHNIIEQDGLQRVIAEFDEQIGLSNLVAVHANDSKTPLASGVDRHDNIGQGNIGLDGFRVIMSNEAFADIPFLLEVPGNDGNGPDKANIDVLKGLRHELTL